MFIFFGANFNFMFIYLFLLYIFYSSPVLKLSECSHTTVIKDMCADCGADLRQNENVSNFLYLILKQN